MEDNEIIKVNSQKAEIERLKADKEALINGQITLQNKLPGVLKSEARKEFVERVKKKAASRTYAQILESDLDEVLVEMESAGE